MKNQRRRFQQKQKPAVVKPEGASATQVVGLVIIILQALLKFLQKASKGEVQRLIGSAETLSAGIRKVLRDLAGVNDEHPGPIAKWQTFYHKHFNLDMDFSNLAIPEKPADGNWRLIIVAAGLSMNQVYDACAKQFTYYRYTDNLDQNIKDIAKRPTGTYAVWVEADEEAPAKHTNKSANDLAAENHNGITLKERLLLELVHFEDTGKHLDISNWTLCSGSRGSGGDVPSADWGDGRFKVSYNHSDYRFSSLRSRAAVS